ncbi:hypothetical protein I6F65_05335 [Pseudoalteromonas sp. SWXJZ94C]|jgi:hypothetical protein|uniref:hypothetical protein n=1 Tax=Pseudoalteromonas sp. SWXJZ94C TaxID=2792065 RepID=UPI0018CF43EE|nr:hypothetical protein [Pseudoalteromonas sp. SWXJZ94C]MBH0056375.1 hypothetical protein [Pseudoalteromonas sp. SWXJZ94C]
MAITKITAEEANKSKGTTNWDDVDALEDSEIEKAASEDPDSALPTDDELDEFKPVKKK